MSKEQIIVKTTAIKEHFISTTSVLRQLEFLVQENNCDRLKQKLKNLSFPINTQNNKGNTLLHVAAAFGNLEATKFLLENDAEIDIKNVCF